MSRGGEMQQILGVSFFRGSVERALARFFEGGLAVAPSAPGLVLLPHDGPYRSALLNADLALLDSGYLALLWRAWKRERVTRISGLRFLSALLLDDRFRKASRFWIVPGAEEGELIRSWLGAQNMPTGEKACYVAPHYGPGAIEDPELLEILEAARPDCIILNIGGGVQEVLGHWLIKRLSYRPGILCTGAAIGFLSGLQTPIPAWIDRLHLGWLLRIRADVRRYGPRYAGAWRLWYLVLKYGRRRPGPAELSDVLAETNH